jgi:molybdate transport system permease protein
MVLPPSVVGYYLLLFLGRSGPLNILGIRIVFTWLAAVIASAVVALPLMVHSSRAAIAAVDPILEKAAGSLGSPPWKVVWDVTLPLARRGILAGVVLAFARGLGEFGATLMVAGNIPGRTQTLPLAIYDLVQANRMSEANIAVLIMTVVAFGLLLTVNRLERRATANTSRTR